MVTRRSVKVRRAPSRRVSYNTDLVTPIVNDRVWHPFDSILPPQQVAKILQGVINGDPLEQENLFNNMVGTWPDLGQALNQICDETSRAPFEVEPFAPSGEQPSPIAEDKAAAIRGLKHTMRPSFTGRDEGWVGTLKGLAMGYFYGLTVREVTWQTTEDGTFPVSTDEYSAINYRYPVDGHYADELLFSPNGRSNGVDLEQFIPGRHLVGENRWHRGGILQTAPLRSLVPYWLAATYGLKWFLDYGQIFGVPFRLGTYPSGDTKAQSALNDALARLGSASWASAPAGTNIEVIPNSQAASTMPQKELIDLANNAVAKFILGQTLTSDVGANGNRALGEIHEGIRRGRIESVVSFVADILNHQLVPAVIQANWTDDAELPTIKADWPDNEDGLKKVERDRILFGELGLPVALKDMYERHETRMPEDGEERFQPAPSGFSGTPEIEPGPSASGEAPRATPRGNGPEPGQAPAEEQEEGVTQAQRADVVQAAQTLNTSTLEALQENVAAMVPGVAREWLQPVADVFSDLVERALDGETTPDEFEMAVAEAAARMPDIELNDRVLEEALEKAIGTAVLAGGGQRALDMPNL
jgi:phage gp29-like protein